MSRKIGSVRLRSGGYQARVTVDGVRYVDTFATEQEAWDYIRAVRSAAVEARTTELTLAAHGQAWLDERETSGRYKSIAPDRYVWDFHVERWTEAHLPIRRLQRKHVVRFLEELTRTEAVDAYRKGGEIVRVPTGRTLSRQSIKHVLRIIRSVLRDAADRGLVSKNVARDVRVPKMDPSPKVWTFIDPEEIELVLAGPYGPKMDQLATRAILTVAIYAGLRKSELWRLRWEHIQLEGDSPELRVVGSKSASGNRTVPAFPPVVAVLRELRSRGGVRRATGLVFPSASGGSHCSTFDAGWSDRAYRRDDELLVRPGIKSRVGIERPVRFHDLRHTFCSHLVQGTWGHAFTLQEVRDLAGHSSIGVTQRYAHLCPEGVAAKAARLSANWPAKGGSRGPEGG